MCDPPTCGGATRSCCDRKACSTQLHLFRTGRSSGRGEGMWRPARRPRMSSILRCTISVTPIAITPSGARTASSAPYIAEPGTVRRPPSPAPARCRRSAEARPPALRQFAHQSPGGASMARVRQPPRQRHGTRGIGLAERGERAGQLFEAPCPDRIAPLGRQQPRRQAFQQRRASMIAPYPTASSRLGVIGFGACCG